MLVSSHGLVCSSFFVYFIRYMQPTGYGGPRVMAGGGASTTYKFCNVRASLKRRLELVAAITAPGENTQGGSIASPLRSSSIRRILEMI